MDDLWDGSAEDKDQLAVDFDHFDWHPDKAQGNYRKHGVRFEEAAQIFQKPVKIEPSDRSEEKRYRAIGKDEAGRTLFVVFTWRGPQIIWIISARIYR